MWPSQANSLAVFQDLTPVEQQYAQTVRSITPSIPLFYSIDLVNRLQPNTNAI